MASARAVLLQPGVLLHDAHVFDDESRQSAYVTHLVLEDATE